jgi:hypothetical protein
LQSTAVVLDSCAGTLGNNVQQQIDASTNSPSLSSLVFNGFVKPAVQYVGYVESGVALTKAFAEDKSKHVPSSVLKFAKAADHQMPDLIRLDKYAGPAMSIAGIAVSSVDLVHGLRTDPGGDDTWNAGADTALAVVGAVAVIAAPESLLVAGAVVGGQLGYSAIEHFDPHITKQIVDTTSTAAKDVWHGAQDAGGAVVHGARDVVEGGFSLISKHLP